MAVTGEARREAIENAIKALDHPGAPQAARINLPYKGDDKAGPFPVVRIEIGCVLFNPRSHRIKAQLESHPQRQIIADDPHSDEAQQIIHEILAASEGFEALKTNLEEYGQLDPGVVTVEGLLVNANTRLAALREIGAEYIDAAVLPPDADDHAIDRLELELQVRRDFKQDYSFTNELVFINDLLTAYEYSEEGVAKAMNLAASSDQKELERGTKRVRQYIRLYALVREIQGLSNGAIPLTFFDDKRQALTDLDDQFEVMKDQDLDEAELVKETRIAGILAGTGYRELRKIDAESIDDYLLPLLGEKDVIGDELDAVLSTTSEPADNSDETTGDDDVDVLTAGDDGTDHDEETTVRLRGLAVLLAQSHGGDEIKLPSGTEVSREEVLNEVAEAMEEAADEVNAANKAAKNLNSPVKQLDEAVKKARAALRGYQQFHKDSGFKEGKFKYHVNKLKVELAAIEKAIEQSEA